MGKLLNTEEREANLRVKKKIKFGKKGSGLFKHMRAHKKQRYMFGYRVQQNAPSMWIMDCVLANSRPDMIVELGTGFGMMTTFFSVYGMLSTHDVEIISLDLTTPKMKDKIESINDNKTHCLNMDIYKPETVNFIADKLNGAERPFLLVDGVDPKSKEVNLYAPKLKSGVTIFAHDANLAGARPVRWGFAESRINWDHVSRLEPYYSWSIEGNTRMLCMTTTGKDYEKADENEADELYEESSDFFDINA